MATPDSLIIPQAPPMPIRAYRRRFISPATNVTDVGPGSVANIYPDTSTPGSFMDPSSTYLSFDMQITNRNFMVDYQNFGPEGAVGAFIQHLRIFNQGTVLEDIAEYGTVSALLARLEGDSPGAFSEYFSNHMENGALGEMHRNMIKPPMCDESGNIMHGLNPFGLGYSSTVPSSVYQNSTTADVAAGAIVRSVGAVYVSTLNADGSGCYTDFQNVTQGPMWVNRGAANELTNRPRNVSPMDWPDFYEPHKSVPIKDKYIMEYGSINKAQVMASLLNVKCFPIGMRPGGDCYNSGGSYGAPANAVYSGAVNVDGGSAVAPQEKVSTIRVCGQFLSGIMGRLATKMLATVLLAPQQLYLQLDTAQVPIALNISSDPCRRIAGTIRDYVRNVGTKNNGLYGANAWDPYNGFDLGGAWQTPSMGPSVTSYAQGYGPFYSIINATKTTTPQAVFSANAANGLFVTQGAQSNTTYDIGGGLANASLAATGILTVPTVASRKYLVPGASFLDITILRQLTANTFQTDTYEVRAAATFADFTNIIIRYPGNTRPLPPAPQYVLTKTPWNFKLITGVASALTLNLALENEVFYGTRLKASVPQVKRILQFTSSDGSSQTTMTATSGMPQFNNTQISYTLLNLSLIGDQIILPDDVTASVIGQAEAGQFNYHTRSVRAAVIQPPRSAEQNIILPLKIAQAKSIHVVWQNMNQRNQGTAIYHDSNCGYNPYAAIYSTGNNVSFSGFSGAGGATTIYGVGFDTPLTYIPTSTGPNALKQQLKIGNELFPPTALTTMAELSTELTKTLHKWGDINVSTNLHGRITATPGGLGTNRSSGIGLASTAPGWGEYPVYECLVGDKFTTAYIDPNLLDDQTITGNADFVPLYGITGGVGVTAVKASDSAANGYNYLCPRGYCVDNVFTVPSGSFSTSINLTTFKPSEGVDGGIYLGNNTIQLMMSGAVGLAHGDWRGVVIVPHRANMSYQSGGQVIWTY